MRVLWISPNDGNLTDSTLNGTGGWIGALQSAFALYSPETVISVVYIGKIDKVDTFNNTTYFSVSSNSSNKVKDLYYNICGNFDYFDKIYTRKILQIINDFKPDIVHVWGIEHSLASVIPYITTPFVVHIQGLTSLYQYTYLPPYVSLSDIIKIDKWWKPSSWKRLIFHNRQIDEYREFIRKANREISISKNIKNWIGRTDWDKRASRILSPNSHYYHCEEIMRAEFNQQKWHFHYDDTCLTIQSSINDTWYKGLDIVLNTASILKKLGVDFRWNIYGVNATSAKLKFYENLLSIRHEEVNVVLHGRVSGVEIKEGLLNCDVYVHPSYIENSSNAIAEAMIMGVPMIAMYAGGNPTMVKDGCGVLVGLNEPYVLASNILDFRNEEFASETGKNALQLAQVRQSVHATTENLVNIYNNVIQNHNK